jgi:superfamily I DNA/RNA helicase
MGIVPQQILQGKQIDEFCKMIGVQPPNSGYDRYDPFIHQFEVYSWARTTGTDPLEAFFRFSDLVDFTFNEYIFFVKSLLRHKEVFGVYEFHDLLDNFDPIEAPANLLIDEAQDNSYSLTMALQKLVTAGVKRMWLVGDPNQAIYTYSGADPKWMYHFDGREVFLDQSYRCPESIVKKAKTLFSDVQFKPVGEQGLVVRDTEIPINPDMVLVRTNYIGHKLMIRTGIDKRKIRTIHKAKGLQGDHIVIYNATTRRVRMSTEMDPVAEKRLLYTAITRARKRLTIVDGGNPNEFI